MRVTPVEVPEHLEALFADDLEASYTAVAELALHDGSPSPRAYVLAYAIGVNERQRSEIRFVPVFDGYAALTARLDAPADDPPEEVTRRTRLELLGLLPLEPVATRV